MFRRMALFLVVAGLVTALLPRQSRSYQIQTCTWMPFPEDPTITNSISVQPYPPDPYYKAYTFRFFYDDVDSCWLNGQWYMSGIDVLGSGGITEMNDVEMSYDPDHLEFWGHVMTDDYYEVRMVLHTFPNTTVQQLGMDDLPRWGNDPPKDGPISPVPQ